MQTSYSKYITRCVSCGRTTSKQHARAHNGQCAYCRNSASAVPTREERILESGYMAYAIEEGHYDGGEN